MMLVSILVLSCLLLDRGCAAPHREAPYSLPQHALNATARADAIAKKNETFIYGPGASGGPYSPAGALGAKFVERDTNITNASLDSQNALIARDQNLTEMDIARYNGLQQVHDYTLLYGDGNWAAASAPTGVAPGVLQNYTMDLLFSMQRLSFSPFLIRRLDATRDTVPFAVDNVITSRLASCTVEDLLREGRLFYADYRFLQSYENNNNGMYSAYTDAMFYISPVSGDFLPLAIRTNANNVSLVYTPHDSPEDWLLAKMMFNADDFVLDAFRHLAHTHYLIEVVYMAAIKTLSDDHPIQPLLARAMYGEFGIRPLAESSLFLPGAIVEQFTPWTGSAIRNLTSWWYFDGGAGNYTSTYFRADLQRRGLLKPAFGPELKHFPYLEDAACIHDAQRQFAHDFVYSYYDRDEDIGHDYELQAWLVETTNGAHAIGFPDRATLNTRNSLVEMLTHFFHQTTTAHHAVNLNQILSASGVLPLNPIAMYNPIPTHKGVENVTAYLPPFSEAIGAIEVGAAFARPLLAHSSLSMVHLFNDEEVLSRMNPATRAANAKFMGDMRARSRVISARAFNSHGLSQGMPFVWQALDPETMQFSTTI